MRKPWYAYLYIKSPLLKIIVGILAVMLAVAVLLFVVFDGPHGPKPELMAISKRRRSLR